MAKRKADVELDDEDDLLSITPLGAGNEVGRSCIILKFKGKTVMLDCGIHPAKNGLAALPFFDEIDPGSVDLLLISHFHLDHVAALPYFTEKTNFNGRVFMTHPTKAITKMLLSDYVRVSNIAVDDMMYDEQDLNKSMDKIELINYHQQLEHNGIKFWCYNAGHVLGAAMFMIEIAGVRVLYTGDFSRHEDRHLMGAETPHVEPHVLIVESTYGVQNHQPRESREAQFTKHVHDIVGRGGRCLIPVFALGRAQELLLILDEYWTAHPELREVPVLYASSLAKKCMVVYQTFINMMNERIRKQYTVSNPFDFKYIRNMRGMEDFDDTGACVVMASPGMLQSGLSRELFERWCTDKRNGVILPGYSVEGTLAKVIMTEPAEVMLSTGRQVPLRLSIHYISFSAHSDFAQTSEFITTVKASHVVLVHGEANEMMRLKGALVQRFADQAVSVHSPKNTESAKMQFRSEKVAKVIGKLALGTKLAAESGAERRISGILVVKDFTHQLMAPEDLPTYTKLNTSTVSQRLHVPFTQQMSLLGVFLRNMFETVSEGEDSYRIYDVISISKVPEQAQLVLEWETTPVTDMLADSIIACVMQVEGNAATVKVMSHAPEPTEESRLHQAAETLRRKYTEVDVDETAMTLSVFVNDTPAVIDYKTGDVMSRDQKLKEDVEQTFRAAKRALYPLPPPHVHKHKKPIVEEMQDKPREEVHDKPSMANIAAGAEAPSDVIAMDV